MFFPIHVNQPFKFCQKISTAFDLIVRDSYFFIDIIFYLFDFVVDKWILLHSDGFVGSQVLNYQEFT